MIRTSIIAATAISLLAGGARAYCTFNPPFDPTIMTMEAYIGKVWCDGNNTKQIPPDVMARTCTGGKQPDGTFCPTSPEFTWNPPATHTDLDKAMAICRAHEVPYYVNGVDTGGYEYDRQWAAPCLKLADKASLDAREQEARDLEFVKRIAEGK